MKKPPIIIAFLVVSCLWGVTSWGTSPQTKRIYDTVYGVAGDTLVGARVSVELLTPDSATVPYDSISGVSLGKNPPPFDTTTDANGYYAVAVIPNSNIIPHGSQYQITVRYGRRIVYSVRVTATGTDSARVRGIQ